MLELLLHLLAQGQRRHLVFDTPVDLLDVVVHLGELELLENFANLLLFDLLGVVNTFLTEFPHHSINDVVGDVRVLLGLKLSEPLIKVIDLLVGEVRDFARGVLVTGLLGVHKDKFVVSATRATELRLVLIKGHLYVAIGAATPAWLNTRPWHNTTLDGRRIHNGKVALQKFVTMHTLRGVNLACLLSCGSLRGCHITNLL